MERASKVGGSHDRALLFASSHNTDLGDQCCLLGTALENEYNEHVKNDVHVTVEIEYNEHVRIDVHVIVEIEDNEHVRIDVHVIVEIEDNEHAKIDEHVIVGIEYNKHVKIIVLVLSIQSYNEPIVTIFPNIALVFIVFIVSYHIVNDPKIDKIVNIDSSVDRQIVSEIVSIEDRSILQTNLLIGIYYFVIYLLK